LQYARGLGRSRRSTRVPERADRRQGGGEGQRGIYGRAEAEGAHHRALSMRLPLAMSCGDPGGIGIEIALAAWLRRDEEGLAPFYLLADPALVHARIRSLGLDIPVAQTDPAGASEQFAGAFPVVALRNRLADTPGRPVPDNAAGIIESIDRAVADCQAGRAAAVVTLPIAKIALHEAGFAHPGHTEYLAHL